MECPVCDAPGAENITVKTGGFETFRCGTCNEFSVSDSVDLTRYDRDQRLAALANAKVEAKPGNRPIILDLAHAIAQRTDATSEAASLPSISPGFSFLRVVL